MTDTGINEIVAKLAESAKVSLKDASRFVFFDEQGNVLAASFDADTSELKSLTLAFNDRDDAVRKGLTVQGTRYEVHRHHPPLLYGRTMGAEPETSEGIAVCKIEQGYNGSACYGVITYQMPNISARMVPILQRFCQQHLVKA